MFYELLIPVAEFASKIVVKSDVNLLPSNLNYFPSLTQFFSILECENSIFTPHETSLSQDYFLFFERFKNIRTKRGETVT